MARKSTTFVGEGRTDEYFFESRAAKEHEAPRRHRLVFFGDTIMHQSTGDRGFIRLFEKYYGNNCDVITRTYPFGFDSRWAKHYFDSIVSDITASPAQHTLIVVCIG